MSGAFQCPYPWMGEEMIVEYAGIADRWAGAGVVHQVRAWWHSEEHSRKKVERAALDVLRRDGNVLDHAEVIGMDMSTYNSPHLNAMVRIRVLTPAQVDERRELAERRYTQCDVCDNAQPSELVELGDGAEHPMCYSCRRGLQGPYKVKRWINADGRIQLN